MASDTAAAGPCLAGDGAEWSGAAESIADPAAGCRSGGPRSAPGFQQRRVEQKLQVLAPFTALPAGATVHVVSARQGFGAGTWLLRLDCDSRRECLPFHAVLRTAQFDQPPSRLHQPAGFRGSPETRGVSRTPLVRSGNAVELVEQLPGVRLRVHVVCLQSGGLGDRIRVENRETHRVISATVAGRDLVRVE